MIENIYLLKHNIEPQAINNKCLGHAWKLGYYEIIKTTRATQKTLFYASINH